MPNFLYVSSLVEFCLPFCISVLVWNKNFAGTLFILVLPVVGPDCLLHFIAIYGIKNIVNCDALNPWTTKIFRDTKHNIDFMTVTC